MECRFVVLTHGVGDCKDMISISCQRIIEWCRRHDMDFRASTHRECTHHVYWDKPFFIRRMMREYPLGTKFVWIDADCVPVQIDISPKDVLGSAEFGARYVIPRDYAAIKNPYYQSGVQFIENTLNTQRMFDGICEAATDPTISTTMPPVWDEDAMNREIDKGYVNVVKIPKEWNAFREEEQPIIRAFHAWDHGRVKEKLRDEMCCTVRRICKL